MTRIRHFLGAVFLVTALGNAPVAAEPLQWGFQGEQFEYRFGKDEDFFAWDFDAFAGSDELKFVWRSEGEYGLDEKAFETLENQARLQVPISPFFDAVGGVRVSTPEGGPNRVHGVLGLKGLTRQWFEVDADLFVSDKPFARFEAEYEALITNRITLIPSVEVDLPFVDDHRAGLGAWGPQVEAGARLSYDLVDRMVSPYIGMHYERKFGETGNLAREEGEGRDALFFVVGTRFVF